MIDPQLILERANISLYCLDHANRRALFVETPSNVDLLQAPFYFIAQYEEAQRLIAVPYDTLHTLAQQVKVDPQDIILFYSTGRCGSTLFSHILNLNPSVISYAEPDVFSQLVALRTSGACSDAETATLLQDCLFLLCANAQLQGFQSYAIKFRSYVLSVSDLLYEMIPQARILFMYRNALTWAHSFSRAFGVSDAFLTERLLNSVRRYVTPSVNARYATHSLTWVEYLAHMWVSAMQDIQWLQKQGASVTTVRFEALRSTPHEIISTAFARLGLTLPDSIQLDDVLAKDSQAGTAGARDKKKPARDLTDSEMRELSQIIHRLDSTLTPNVILR